MGVGHGNPVTRHILWTGGWDSTYRVLYVLFVRNEVVQPHYIIDLQRKSWMRELQAQAAVRAQLTAENADVAARLLPARLVLRHELPVNATAQAQYCRLVQAGHPLGEQTQWLVYYVLGWQARLSRNADDPPVSIPFEMGCLAGERVHTAIEGELELQEVQGEMQYMLRATLHHPDLALFRHLSFPIMGYTKVQMGELAQQYGFAHLLDQSWFCHKPLLKNIPCGVCVPCVDARSLGMVHRLHFLSHACYYANDQIIRRLKLLLRNTIVYTLYRHLVRRRS